MWFWFNYAFCPNSPTSALVTFSMDRRGPSPTTTATVACTERSEIIARSKFCNIKSYLAHWKVKARYRATPISWQEFRVLLKDTSAGGLLPFSVQQHTIKCNKDVFLQSVICLSQSHPLHCSTSVLLFLVMSYTWFKLSQEIGIHAAISFLFKAGYLRSFFCM